MMCDASEQAAIYVLLTEDYTDTADGPHKFFAPAAVGSRIFTTVQILLTM